MSNNSFRAKANPLATCAAIALLAASCVIGEPQPRQPQSRHYVIEPPNGRLPNTRRNVGARSSTYLHDARFSVPSRGYIDNSSQHDKARRAQVSGIAI